jgi:hypothetical protein
MMNDTDGSCLLLCWQSDLCSVLNLDGASAFKLHHILRQKNIFLVENIGKRWRTLENSIGRFFSIVTRSAALFERFFHGKCKAFSSRPSRQPEFGAVIVTDINIFFASFVVNSTSSHEQQRQEKRPTRDFCVTPADSLRISEQLIANTGEEPSTANEGGNPRSFTICSGAQFRADSTFNWRASFLLKLAPVF